MGNSENEKLNIYYFKKLESKAMTSDSDNNNKEKEITNNSKKEVKQFNLENKNLYNLIYQGQEIEEEKFSSLTIEIKNNLRKKPVCNCVLIFFDYKEYREKLPILDKYLDENLKVYKPIVILAFNEKNKKEINNLNENKYDIVFYKENDYTKIYEEIKSVYNYYFNIGDQGFINFIELLDNLKSKNKKNENEENICKYKATINILVMGRTGSGKSTLINLLLGENRALEGIGYSITKLYTQYTHRKYPITFTDTIGFKDDKSIKRMKTFLSNYNEFFNEGKSKFHLVLYLLNAGSERTFVRSELELIDDIRNKYKLPIFFVCTHSCTEEDSQEFKEEVKISLIQYLEEKSKEKKFNLKKKILEESSDSINQNQTKLMNSDNQKATNQTCSTNPLQVKQMNSGNHDQTQQTISGSQVQTYENALGNQTIKNKYSTQKNSINKDELKKKYKEEKTKLNFEIQEEKINLIDRIYCCHLKTEKDGKYKRFGIDKILSGIKNLFTNEISQIKIIEGKIKNKENIPKESSSNEEKNKEKKKPFNIMKSLENSKSFDEYLKNLLFKICDKYYEKIFKILEENQSGFSSIIERLSNILKNQLADELNCNSSVFDIKKEDENNGPILNFIDKFLCQKENIQNEKKMEKKNIEKIINNMVNKDINKINSDMMKVIESYENGINYFQEMIKNLNNNNKIKT